VKNLKKYVKKVILNDNNKCSVCIQHTDGGVMAYSKMDKIDTMWGKDELTLFVVNTATFIIPYSEIEYYTTYHEDKTIEIVLTHRRLVSVRGYLK
jgi:hypothetical protein